MNIEMYKSSSQLISNREQKEQKMNQLSPRPIIKNSGRGSSTQIRKLDSLAHQKTVGFSVHNANSCASPTKKDDCSNDSSCKFSEIVSDNNKLSLKKKSSTPLNNASPIDNGPGGLLHCKSMMPPKAKLDLNETELSIGKGSSRVVAYKMDVNAKIKQKVNDRQKRREAFRNWFVGNRTAELTALG